MHNSRILVVEDDNVLAHHLKVCLKLMGHIVVDVCCYGEDAVEKARQLAPDLILMDINLRGPMNGVEAMQEIHGHIDIPVVYLTAYEDDKTLQSTKITDPFGYLLKPFRENELKIVIEIALYRHRMEKALRERERQLQQAYLKLTERQGFIESILANIQSGIIVTDLDFRILLMNPSAEKFLNVPGETVAGRHISVLCQTFADALHANKQGDEIYCNVCPREHIIGFKMFDMKGKDGLVNGHIISFADVTEIVKIRKEIKLKERLANMGEFVARVAHEIRNPLFGMTAICQIFSMELKLDDEHKKLMDTMMKEALRLKQNVEELLDCSRELKIDKKKCDLLTILDDTLFENRVFLGEKNILVERNIPDADFTIDADQDKIRQVIVNLLKNAVEASPNNESIKMALEADHQQISFSICDAGTGIPNNIIEKIFDVFYTTKRNGTGLGLAICKNIIAAHGGAILAQNNNEGGATFVFTLPKSL